MENVIQVIEDVQKSVTQMQKVSVGLKQMGNGMPAVTTQVSEFTKTMTQMKRQTTEAFVSIKGSIAQIEAIKITKSESLEASYEKMTASVTKAVKQLEEPAKKATRKPKEDKPKPAKKAAAKKTKASTKKEENKDTTKKAPKKTGTKKTTTPRATKKDNPTIGQSIKGMPDGFAKLRKEYDDIIASADKFGNIVKGVADKVLIQSGAAQFLIGEIPQIGQAYNALQQPMQTVMEKVGAVGGVVGDFVTNFHEGIDMAAGFAAGIKDAYTAVEGGLQSFNSYVKTVKEIDTMVRALTDAQKWAAFFTNIYTAAQSALNVVLNLSPLTIVIGLLLALGAVFKILWDRSERFRKLMFGIWEVAKFVFKGIFELASACTSIWTKVVEVITAILKNPLSAGDIISTAIDSVTDKFKGIWDGLGAAFNEGTEKGGESFAKSQEEKKEEELLKGGNVGSVTAPTAGLINPPSINEGAGTKPHSNAAGKTIAIKIESLVKEVNIFNNVKQGAQEMRNLIRDELVAAVRDFEKTPSYG